MKINQKISLVVMTLAFLWGIKPAYTEIEHITPRYRHSAVYDSANKKMIVFGGCDGRSFSDTWIFDMESLQDNSAKASLKKNWETIATDEKPAPRYSHSAIYDPENKQMLIFGGFNGFGAFFDTWVFDIEKKEWKEIEFEEEKAPSPRFGHSAIYDSANKQMIIFGGINNKGKGFFKYFSDIWIFDIKQKTWEKIKSKNTPPARCDHSAIYDSKSHQMIIYGGRNDGAMQQQQSLSDTWAYDIEKNTWKEIKTEDFPPARYGHTTIYDPVKDRVILIGGGGDNGQIFPETWAFDIKEKEWEKIKTNMLPKMRNNNSAIYNPEKHQMIIFGGEKGNPFLGEHKIFSDTWVFDIEQKKWEEIKTQEEE